MRDPVIGPGGPAGSGTHRILLPRCEVLRGIKWTVARELYEASTWTIRFGVNNNAHEAVLNLLTVEPLACTTRRFFKVY